MNEKKLVKQLTKTVKKYPCLYDLKTSYSRSRSVVIKRNSAWDSVAAHVGANVNECKLRWRRLRDRYNKELNKLSNKRVNGDNLHSDWKFFKYMQFLDPYLQSKVQISKPTSHEADQGEEVSLVPDDDSQLEQLSVNAEETSSNFDTTENDKMTDLSSLESFSAADRTTFSAAPTLAEEDSDKISSILHSPAAQQKSTTIDSFTPIATSSDGLQVEEREATITVPTCTSTVIAGSVAAKDVNDAFGDLVSCKLKTLSPEKSKAAMKHIFNYLWLQ